MKVLLAHAHPEKTSVTYQLVEAAIEVLRGQGHDVMESDLYAMGWKAVFDDQDFPERANPARLSFIEESGHAFSNGCQTPDVEEEQRKILTTDALILLFPLWWFSMPAIMKGWVDRVWAYGLAYGYQGAGNTYRYGGHHAGDKQEYKEAEEVAIWRERDPILRLARHLTESGLADAARLDAIRAEVAEVIRGAVAEAKKGAEPAPGELKRDLYA